ncbi:MAG: hypothetical protein RL701_6590 [Pseudomonadota bacterium]|jgi:RNA polymerase sigma-70 factor (ECF subfamily)
MQPPTADAELLERAARGDVAAFAGIYDRHAPAVLALLRRLLGNLSAAQDIMHDVFIEAWRRACDYDAQRGSVRAWLLVRARSRALDQRKSEHRERNSRTYLGERVSASGLPELQSLPTERRLAVEQALAKLEACEREVLELTYFEGLTGAEIGARIGVPEGTVRSRVARGLEALRQTLEFWKEDP